MIVFFVVVLALTVGIHWYLYDRLFRGPEWPAPVPTIGGWALVALAASVPLSMIALA